MPFSTWNQSLSVGNAILDAQHQELFRTVNRLAEAVEQGKGDSSVFQALAHLAGYASTHFACEERMMAEQGYPGLERHQKMHRLFQERLKSFTLEDEVNMPPQMLLYLRAWLTDHIANEDQRFSAFMKAPVAP